MSRLLLVPLLAVALLTGGCVGPALVDEHYLGQAISSLDRARDRVEAARITADAASRDRITEHLAATILGETEHATGYARDAFASRQPPPGMDELRDRTLTMLDEASSLLAEVRIAAARGRLDEVAAKGADLEDLASRLEQRVTELRS